MSILILVSQCCFIGHSWRISNQDASSRSNVEGALLSRLGGAWHCPLIASAGLGIQLHTHLLLRDCAVKASMLDVMDSILEPKRTPCHHSSGVKGCSLLECCSVNLGDGSHSHSQLCFWSMPSIRFQLAFVCLFVFMYIFIVHYIVTKEIHKKNSSLSLIIYQLWYTYISTLCISIDT